MDNLRPESSEATDFLLAEYGAINDETRRIRSEALNRLNFYIALTTTIGGGLVILVQLSTEITLLLKMVSILAIGFLVLIGIETMRYVVQRDINTDFNVRASGRISRYFADKYPDIIPYLTWQTNDESTKWVTANKSGLRRSVQIILSLQIGTVAGLIFLFSAFNIYVASSAFAIAFIISYLLLSAYARRKYAKADRSASNASRFRS